MFRFKAKIVFFVSLLSVFNAVFAGQSNQLYYVEIPVADEAGDTRWRAFTEGLDEVFIRISGDSIIMDKLKRPAASRYVKQFSYEPIDEPLPDDKGELLSHRLKIQYNGSAMEKYLLDNGFPVWGQHRPAVVVWLAVRDGSNEYVLKQQDSSLLKTAADNALVRRGVPQRWPVHDRKDRKILSVADIRGGFKDPILKVSKRYSSGPALAGSLLWNGREWQSSWSLLMTAGDRHWSLVDTDYNRLISKAIDQAADVLGVVFAVHNSKATQSLAIVQLDIQSISRIDKYRYVEEYLRELNAVEFARPVQVDGEAAVFEVSLKSSEQDFISLLKNDGVFVAVSVDKVAADELPADMIKPSLDIAQAKDEAVNSAAIPIEENATGLSQANIAMYHFRLAR